MLGLARMKRMVRKELARSGVKLQESSMNRTEKFPEQGKAVAVRMTERCDAEGFPAPASWERALPLRFDTDWQGKNADPKRETKVRLLWTPEILFLRFRAKYRAITVFPDSEPN